MGEVHASTPAAERGARPNGGVGTPPPTHRRRRRRSMSRTDRRLPSSTRDDRDPSTHTHSRTPAPARQSTVKSAKLSMLGVKGGLDQEEVSEAMLSQLACLHGAPGRASNLVARAGTAVDDDTGALANLEEHLAMLTAIEEQLRTQHTLAKARIGGGFCGHRWWFLWSRRRLVEAMKCFAPPSLATSCLRTRHAFAKARGGGGGFCGVVAAGARRREGARRRWWFL